MRSDVTPGFGGHRPASFQMSKGSVEAEARELLDSLARPLHEQDELLRARFQVPYVLSLILFCVFAAPTIISLHLGTDPDAAFWIGRVGLLAIVVPLFLAVIHLVHLREISRGTQRRGIIDVSAVVPGVLLAIIGVIYSSEGAFVQTHLASSDCTSRVTQPLDDKPRLQAAYVLGLKAYAACQERHFQRNGNQTLPSTPHPTLQECWEWQTMNETIDFGEEIVNWRAYVEQETHAEWLLGSLGFNWISRNYWARRPKQIHQNYWREWDYLAQVEANHICGGFCQSGPSLFVGYDMSGRQGGRCAPLVSLKFRVIRYQGELILWTSVISLILLLAVLKPMTKAYVKEIGYWGGDDV